MVAEQLYTPVVTTAERATFLFVNENDFTFPPFFGISFLIAFLKHDVIYAVPVS